MVRWLELHAPIAGAQVQSLVGEVRCYKTFSVAGKTNKQTNRKNKTGLAVYLFSNILVSKDPSTWFVTII